MSEVVTVSNFTLERLIVNNDGNSDFEFTVSFFIDKDKQIRVQGNGKTDHTLNETNILNIISLTTVEELLDKIENMEYGVYKLDTYFWIDYNWENKLIKIVYKMI
jgi:hypothetical protein